MERPGFRVVAPFALDPGKEPGREVGAEALEERLLSWSLPAR